MNATLNRTGRIGLGTVQFGTSYGISNREGQTSLQEVSEIAELARRSGIRFIDTAPAYGNAESVLSLAGFSKPPFQILTKTPRFDKPSSKALKRAFHESLEKLGVQSVYGLMLHRGEDLLKPEGAVLYEALLELKDSGKVQKIGASVYMEAEIEAITAAYEIDLIQLPINVFDQRLLKNGVLKALKKKGIEIHARSVFLQGLLLMSPEELPPALGSLANHLANFLSNIRPYSPLKACLEFALGLGELDAVICGVNTRQQFEEILSFATSKPLELDFNDFAFSDPSLLNPAHWPVEV